MVVALESLCWGEGHSKEVGLGKESSEHLLAVELLSLACLSCRGETCLGVTIRFAGTAGGGGGGGGGGEL